MYNVGTFTTKSEGIYSTQFAGPGKGGGESAEKSKKFSLSEKVKEGKKDIREKRGKDF